MNKVKLTEHDIKIYNVESTYMININISRQCYSFVVFSWNQSLQN